MAVMGRSAAARPLAVLALLSLLCGASAGWLGGGSATGGVIVIEGQATLDAALKEHDFLVVEYYAPVRPPRSPAAARRARVPCRVGCGAGAACAARRAPAPPFRAGAGRGVGTAPCAAAARARSARRDARSPGSVAEAAGAVTDATSPRLPRPTVGASAAPRVRLVPVARARPLRRVAPRWRRAAQCPHARPDFALIPRSAATARSWSRSTPRLPRR